MAHGRTGSVHAYMFLEVPRIAPVGILGDLWQRQSGVGCC